MRQSDRKTRQPKPAESIKKNIFLNTSCVRFVKNVRHEPKSLSRLKLVVTHKGST